jgi:alkanesulfonate monooxygenase SsuD/methylene tetrahydromethanopterin reductase-like flavin-dependent oxidoreductase (luciferase family)
VTGVGYRNLGHLAKLVATLDVLSGGRALCGLGAGWFEREHRLYGWEFPPLRERFARLEDALQLLPLMWGPGAPRFEGRTVTVEEAVCYPRPLQERIPILVGGSGERRTLRLVARHADACNLFGDPDTVRHKVGVLRGHCAAEGRDPADVSVTHLAAARVIADGEERAGPGAATAEEHVGRYRELAEAGVRTAIVGLGDADGPSSVERFAPVVAAFQG